MEWTRNRLIGLFALAVGVSLAVGTVVGVFVGLGLTHATQTYRIEAKDFAVIPPASSSAGLILPGVGTAFCNAGDTVVGGGYGFAPSLAAPYNRTDIEPLRVIGSQAFTQPFTGIQGWTVGWWWEANTTPDFTVDVFAICQT